VRIIVLCIASLALAGCATTIVPAGNSENVWVIEKRPFLYDMVLYCTPGRSLDAKIPEPACYEADRMSRPKKSGSMPFGMFWTPAN